MGLDSGRMRGSTSFCLSVCLTLCFFQLKVGGAAFCLLNQNELLQCQHHYHETIIINLIKIVHMSHHHHPHPTRDFHWNHSFILAGGGDGGNGAAAHDIIHMPPKWLE